jgi:4-carboxymuconolactone decarboxylase
LEPRDIALGPDAPGWDPFEAALLRAVDEMYRDAMISDRTWKILSARYGAADLLSVLMTAANYRMVSIALNAFGVQHEPGDEPFPQIPLR